MQLFYREKGNPSAPSLILLHGLWGASDNWLHIAGLLANQFHVILPDFRNHGNSPYASEHTYKVLSQDILTFIRHLHLPQKPFLAGHSMGGKVLMQLLLQKPEITAKAAILDISPKTYPLQEADIHSQVLAAMRMIPLQTLGNRTQIHQFIRQHFSSEELCQLLFKNIRKTLSGFEWKINRTAIQSHLSEILSWSSPVLSKSNPCPILFIKSEYSDYIDLNDLPVIRSFFPSAVLTVLPQASHRLHLDQPQLLAKILIEFFSNPQSGYFQTNISSK